MLKNFKLFLAAFFVVCVSATSLAAKDISFMGLDWDESAAWQDGDLWFTIDPGLAEAKVCAVLRSDNQLSAQQSDVSIPTYSRGYKVIAILESAFRNNTSVTSVRIPHTVSGIAPGAFAGATELRTVEIDPKNSTFKTISGVVFTADTQRLVLWPAALTGVDETAFRNIEWNSIEEWACAYAKSMPRNLFRYYYGSTISDYAFYNSGLTSIQGNRIDVIGKHAFDGCKSLTSIPSNTPRIIGDYAFARSGVRVGIINMSEYSEYIGKGIFAECQELKSFTASKYPENTRIYELSDSCCYACNKLESVQCAVPSIGESVFEGCTALKNVRLIENVTDIRSKAFSGCVGMSNVISFNPVPPTFADDAFAYVPNSCFLTVNKNDVAAYAASRWNDIFTLLPQEIKLGNLTYYLNAQTMEASCIYYDGTESELTIPATITVGYYNFKVVSAIGGVALNSRSTLRKVTLPATVLSIDGFAGCSELTEINYPDNLLNIAGNAFRNCVKLGNPVIPASVNGIGNNPYQGCTSITSIDVAEGNSAHMSYNGDLYSSLYSRGDMLAATPASRSSVTVREGTVRIAEYACAGSPYLKTVTIPASTGRISYTVFMDCPLLENINVSEENTLLYFSNAGLYGRLNDVKTELILVPQSYKTVTVDDGTYRIAQNAFLSSPVLESIDIPASVEYISPSAFANCKALKSVTCHGETPPVCTWMDGMEKTIDVSEVTLYVPVGAAKNYHQANGMIWRRFKSIVETDFSAVENITVDNSDEKVEYFNIHGVRVENPLPGMYIRRKGNTVSKVMIQ